MIDTITQKIGTGSENIRVFKNFVDLDDLKILQDIAKEQDKQRRPDMFYGIQHPDSIKEIREKYKDKIINNIIDFYQYKSAIEYPNEDLIILCHPEGSEMHPHVDIVGYIQGEENGNRNMHDFWSGHLAGLIYLNDDYDGGELYFPDWGISIKPKAGTFVSFPGNKNYLHGVKKIINGTRYTMSIWVRFAEARGQEIYSYGKEK